MSQELNAPPRSGFLNFFFRPTDPSSLGFMRIFTGLLVLYVLFAYSFDLTAFFGKDGWLPLDQANTARKERPYAASPLESWETEWHPNIRLPHSQHRREVIIAYLKNLPGDPVERSHATAYYFNLPDHPETMRAGLEFIDSLPWDLEEREKVIDQIRTVKFDPQNPNKQIPEVLQRLPDNPVVRHDAMLAVQEFVKWLPGPVEEAKDDGKAKKWKSDSKWGTNFPVEPNQDLTQFLDQRRYVLNFFDENRPTRKQLGEYLDALPKDKAARFAAIDYLDEWDVDPNQTFAQGMPVWSIWYHVTDPTAMKITHIVIIGIVVMFTLGLFTRVTSVLAWVAVLSYTHRTTHVLFGMDVMMNIAMVYLMIAPSGAALSLDRLIQRYRIIRASYRRSGGIDALATRALEGPPRSMLACFVTRLFQIHFCFIYLAAGLSKLKGDTWWNTYAMWLTMANPEFSPMNVGGYQEILHHLSELRWAHAIVMTSCVVFTLIMEIGLPFMVWTRLRPYMVIGSASLHAGVGMFMGLTVFSLFMMVLVFCYIPPAAVRERTAGWRGLPRLRLRFRSDNARQLRRASIARAIDVNGQIELIDTVTEPEEKRTAVIEVLGPDGEKGSGVDAFALLLRNLRLARKVLPILWPFVALAMAIRGGSSSSNQTPKPTAAATRKHLRPLPGRVLSAYAPLKLERSMKKPTHIKSARQILEEAIIAAPEDRTAHAAYADLLIEQSDPQGEFMRIQLALEEPNLSESERKALTERESEWLDVHEVAMLGSLAPYRTATQPSSFPRVYFTYRRGLLDSIQTTVLPPDLAVALRDSPATRFLRQFGIESAPFAGEFGDISLSEAVSNLNPIPFMQSLRTFQLGQTPDDVYQLTEAPWGELIPEYDFPYPRPSGAGVADFMSRFPKLEHGLLFGEVHPYEIFQLKLPHLRSLKLYHFHGTIPLATLADNPAMTNLETLVLHPFMEGNTPLRPVQYVGFTDFLSSPHLQNLRHVRFRCNDLDDGDMLNLEEANWLRRLRTLDLRHGRVGNRGARYIIDCSDFDHLSRLDLRGNRLTKTGIRAVRRAADDAGVHVNLSHQRRRDIEGYEGERYESVDE